MLRTKIYNYKKTIGINKYFKMKINPSFFNNLYVKSMIIKDCKLFMIIKNIDIGLYFWSFKNLILIHLDEQFINDFEYLYKKSDKYIFDIYSNIYNGKKIYHIYCISRYLDELCTPNYINFLDTNDSEYSYNCLTRLYGPCLIINKRFDIFNDTLKYSFYKTIGCAKINIIIKNQIISSINIINNYYMKNLPPHYLI